MKKVSAGVRKTDGDSAHFAQKKSVSLLEIVDDVDNDGSRNIVEPIALSFAIC